jgi:hypothetical protein
MASDLTAKRVLLVEDEMLISILIEDILADEGCQVIGLFTNPPDALAAEAKVGCNVLNRMTGLGMPFSARIR